ESRVRPYDFSNWRPKRQLHQESVGLATVDPHVPLKGIIICVHGLGLHHGTFRAFGEAISHNGFETIALDMRGFGSFAEDKAHEKVDFRGCLDDLEIVLKVVRRDNPGFPVFLLGESMGGAIALQEAALHPELVDGLVCSVPSGSRFKSKRTGLKVALKYVAN